MARAGNAPNAGDTGRGLEWLFQAASAALTWEELAALAPCVCQHWLLTDEQAAVLAPTVHPKAAAWLHWDEHRGAYLLPRHLPAHVHACRSGGHTLVYW